MVKGLVNGVQKEVMVTVVTASSATKTSRLVTKERLSLLKHSSSSRHIDAVKNSIDPNQAKLFASVFSVAEIEPTVHNQPGTWTNFSS